MWTPVDAIKDKWKKIRPNENVSHLDTIVENDTFLILMSVCFEAGRQWQHDHPTASVNFLIIHVWTRSHKMCSCAAKGFVCCECVSSYSSKMNYVHYEPPPIPDRLSPSMYVALIKNTDNGMTLKTLISNCNSKKGK